MTYLFFLNVNVTGQKVLRAIQKILCQYSIAVGHVKKKEVQMTDKETYNMCIHEAIFLCIRFKRFPYFPYILRNENTILCSDN